MLKPQACPPCGKGSPALSLCCVCVTPGFLGVLLWTGGPQGRRSQWISGTNPARPTSVCAQPQAPPAPQPTADPSSHVSSQASNIWAGQRCIKKLTDNQTLNHDQERLPGVSPRRRKRLEAGERPTVGAGPSGVGQGPQVWHPWCLDSRSFWKEANIALNLEPFFPFKMRSASFNTDPYVREFESWCDEMTDVTGRVLQPPLHPHGQGRW